MIADDLDMLDAQQLRERLRATRAEVAFKQALIDKLTHENAILKRLKFSARSEKYTPEQRSLLDETFDTDMAALAAEIEALQPSGKSEGDKQQPRREKLPAHLPRREIHHQPHDTIRGSCRSPAGQAQAAAGQPAAARSAP